MWVGECGEGVCGATRRRYVSSRLGGVLEGAEESVCDEGDEERPLDGGETSVAGRRYVVSKVGEARRGGVESNTEHGGHTETRNVVLMVSRPRSADGEIWCRR